MSEASDSGLLSTTFQMNLWKKYCGVNISPAATSPLHCTQASYPWQRSRKEEAILGDLQSPSE